MTAVSEGIVAAYDNGPMPGLEASLGVPIMTVPDTAEGILSQGELTPKAKLLGQLASGEITRDDIDLQALDPNDFSDEEAAFVTGKPIWAAGYLGRVYHRRNAGQLFNLAVSARVGYLPGEPSTMMGKAVHDTYVRQAELRRTTTERHARKRAGLPDPMVTDNADDLE